MASWDDSHEVHPTILVVSDASVVIKYPEAHVIEVIVLKVFPVIPQEAICAYPNKAAVPSPAFDTVLSVPSLHFLH